MGVACSAAVVFRVVVVAVGESRAVRPHFLSQMPNAKRRQESRQLRAAALFGHARRLAGIADSRPVRTYILPLLTIPLSAAGHHNYYCSAQCRIESL